MCFTLCKYYNTIYEYLFWLSASSVTSAHMSPLNFNIAWFVYTLWCWPRVHATSDVCIIKVVYRLPCIHTLVSSGTAFVFEQATRRARENVSCHIRVLHPCITASCENVDDHWVSGWWWGWWEGREGFRDLVYTMNLPDVSCDIPPCIVKSYIANIVLLIKCLEREVTRYVFSNREAIFPLRAILHGARSMMRQGHSLYGIGERDEGDGSKTWEGTRLGFRIPSIDIYLRIYTSIYIYEVKCFFLLRIPNSLLPWRIPNKWTQYFEMDFTERDAK